HQHHQLHLAPRVDAVARAVLGRREELELALPVAQDVRLELGELADVTDGKELADRLRARRHQSFSAFRSRVISSTKAQRAGCRSKSTLCTALTIGISTPCFSASSLAVSVVVTPSATVSRPCSTSFKVAPRPISRPTLRLRESDPVHVSTRSPIPARPAKVSGSAPSFTPRRVISARPRVISAAR